MAAPAVSRRTVDVGGGGMRVKSVRPLSVDETVRFSLALNETVLEGEARVLRMPGFNEYALRFEDPRPDAAAILAEVLDS